MKKYSRIVLTGMKHTGKSTLGTLLAAKLSLPFYDTDAVIAEITGKTARELFDEGGAALMIARETDACRLLAGRGECVIATGGGLADNAEAIEALRNDGLFVFIDTPFDVLFERVTESARKDGRLPKFLQGPNPREQFQELFNRRTKTYATITDVIISAGTRTPPEILDELTGYLKK
jgi:shikimate kinase